MAPRTRLLAFGSAAGLVVIGALCLLVINGFTGQLLAICLISAGLGAAVLLVFLEVGLSEDRERAEEEEQRRRTARSIQMQPRRRRRLPRRPRRPG